MIRIVSYNQDNVQEYLADPAYMHETTNDSFGRILLRCNCEDDDYVGVLTDGRFFVRNSQPLTGEYVSTILKSYDCILPCPTGKLADMGMIIARGFVLRTLRDSLSNVDLDDTVAVSDALIRLIREKSYKVKSENISKESPELWNIGNHRIEVLQGYVDAVLGEYIELRKRTGFAEGFAEANPYMGDFEGRIPVWICWWQGFESAPELVRACVDSVQRNLPDSAKLIVITYDNCHEYITLTDAVRDRFERGIITPTHLSDILRAELLYRYGGMWIDATYYVSRPITEEFLGQDLYSLRFIPPLWGMDIQRGRWTLSLLVARKGHPAMQFLMEGLWLYWENSTELVDYFLVDYVCDAGYRHIDTIRTAFDIIEPASPAVYDLQLELNQRISPTDIVSLRSKSGFYKINRRNEYVKETQHGFDTFYGHIVDDGCGEATVNKSIQIKCDTESELIRVIREVNPYDIIDVDGYFEETDWISRGLLDDLILHDLKILKSLDNSNGFGKIRSIYDDGYTDIELDRYPIMIIFQNRYSLFCC